MLKEVSVPTDYPMHLHCFNSTWDVCQLWMNSYTGIKIGFTPLITFDSASCLKEVVRKIPLARMLVATDSPYFNVNKMEPFSNPNQVAIVITEIHALRKRETLVEVLQKTRKNASEVYNI